MNLEIEWGAPIAMRDATRENLIYKVDLAKLPSVPGIYIMGRRFGKTFEALYVGRAQNIQRRIKQQLNSLKLMQSLRNARAGQRVVLPGRLVPKRGLKLDRGLAVAERALIRYFLSEGHDLVNVSGTSLRRHEVASHGRHPKKFWASLIYLERGRRE
jgi:hypothetical protein